MHGGIFSSLYFNGSSIFNFYFRKYCLTFLYILNCRKGQRAIVPTNISKMGIILIAKWRRPPWVSKRFEMATGHKTPSKYGMLWWVAMSRLMTPLLKFMTTITHTLVWYVLRVFIRVPYHHQPNPTWNAPKMYIIYNTYVVIKNYPVSNVTANMYKILVV